MNFEQRLLIPASPAELWRFLMDVPQMATCVPGVENVVAEGDDHYKGVLKVKLGPINLALNGTMTIQERDEQNWRAVGRAEAADRRVGGGTRVNATMNLIEKAPGQTEMVVQAEVRFLGKLGEFGEPLIRKQADATVAAFARNVAAHFAAAAPAPGATGAAAAGPSGVAGAGTETRPAPATPPAAQARARPWIGAGLGLAIAIVAMLVLPMPAWLARSWAARAGFAIALAALGAFINRNRN